MSLHRRAVLGSLALALAAGPGCRRASADPVTWRIMTSRGERRFRVPRQFLDEDPATRDFLVIRASFPSFGAPRVDVAADLFITLSAAGRETGAERLAHEASAPSGSDAARRVAPAPHPQVFEYTLGRSPDRYRLDLHDLDGTWLTVDHGHSAAQSIAFDRRYADSLELKFQIARPLVKDPLDCARRVAAFLDGLREA